jgi:uncharacterized membrane protein YphA (DoxX/SURF4 family)
MSDRARYGLSTMLALVALRLAIGWHFYSEGIHHLTEPHWSSESFLKAAKGPLAEKYQSVLPTFHHWEAALHGSGNDAALNALASRDATDDYVRRLPKEYTIEKEQRAGAEPLLRWGARFDGDMARYLEACGHFYALTEEQMDSGKISLSRRQAQAMDWLGSNLKKLEDHLHEWSRLEKARHEISSGDIPFQKRRIADKLTLLKREAASWTTELQNIESGYHTDLYGLLEAEQKSRGSAPEPRTLLDKIDLGMAYGITAVGVCLVLGLFTRLACLAGLAFLLSVVLSQPFWIADAQPTYNQTVELLAIAALATVPVGRWGGLDFFVHYLRRRGKG